MIATSRPYKMVTILQHCKKILKDLVYQEPSNKGLKKTLTLTGSFSGGIYIGRKYKADILVSSFRCGWNIFNPFGVIPLAKSGAAASATPPPRDLDPKREMFASTPSCRAETRK